MPDMCVRHTKKSRNLPPGTPNTFQSSIKGNDEYLVIKS